MFNGLRRKLRRKLVLVEELEEHNIAWLLEDYIQKERFAHKSYNKIDHRRSLRQMHNLRSEVLDLPLLFDQKDNYKLKKRLRFRMTFLEEKDKK